MSKRQKTDDQRGS